MTPRILAIGEILWDLLPAGKQLGGAPANFAFHCRSLGADASLVTRIGDDAPGREVLERLGQLRLPTGSVQVDREWPTGTVEVALAADGQPRYTIREQVAWDRIQADEAAIERASHADAICFGSLAQRSGPAREAIQTLLKAARPGALRIFDVNLRPPFVDRGVIEASLKAAEALKLNDQELPELAAMFDLPGGERGGMAALADAFGLSLIALTRGAGGSVLLADGEWSENPGHPVDVSDTIGAGDAFTATLVVGRLAARPLDEINRHANVVAAFVCSRPGGTPTLPDALKFAADLPPETRP